MNYNEINLLPSQDWDILSAPLMDLVKNQDELVASQDLTSIARKSSLYSDRYNQQNSSGNLRHGRESLGAFSCIDGGDILTFLKTGRNINKALLTQPRSWLISRGTTGAKKWLPITLQDIARWFKRIQRLDNIYMGDSVDEEKLIWAINEPLPKVSNAIPYLWEQVDYHYRGSRLEWIIVSMEMLPRNHWDQFVIKKQPQWILSSVKDALGFASYVDNEGSNKVRDQIPNMERGIFWGDNLDDDKDHRSKLESIYGIPDVFSIYLSAECREMYAECSAHDGLHLWMDEAIHEMRLKNGEILFVDQASAGIEGEYIFTCFYEALPLIRYKTGDLIRVVSNDPCECGITHPRVKFIGRVEG